MSAPTLAQAAGVEAMEAGDGDVARMRREYRRRRDFLVPALNDLGLPTALPRGAFYVFADVRPTGLSSEEFAMRLLKDYGVACVPGEAFGPCGNGFVRMSYATALNQLARAVERMAKMLKA
jgi:aminotransferase